MKKAIEALSEIDDQFDGYLVDQYGVIHDGMRTHYGIHHTLKALKEQAKPIVMISNSGRSGDHSRGIMEGLGIPSALFDDIVTSGDCSKAIMEKIIRDRNQHLVCYPIVNDPRTDFLKQMGYEITTDPKKAQVVYLAGIEGRNNDIQSYLAELETFHHHGALMVCANADVHCLSRGELKFGPGRLAQIYSEMGGDVKIIGKPHMPIFELALERLGKSKGDLRTLMVGDSIYNDVQGASNVGLHSLLIGCGIHKGDLGLAHFSVDEMPRGVMRESLAHATVALAEAHQLPSPDYVMPLWIW